MKLTERDLRLIRDITLSHVLSRDQVVSLGYFASVTRANTRLRELRGDGYVSALAVPFHGQHLYAAGARAAEAVGARVADLLRSRHKTPRFLQHALASTEVRLALLGKGYAGWRFEAQLRHSFLWGGLRFEVRPDGLTLRDGWPILVEVDLGHVSRARFSQKMKGYEAFALSGEARRLWKIERLSVLTVTTGDMRRAHLKDTVAPDSPLEIGFRTFEELGIRLPGSWS